MSPISLPPLLRVPHFPVAHGFSLRLGGVSQGAYAGLNLDEREDEWTAVQRNRQLLAEALGTTPERFARLQQVHGTAVIHAKEPGVWTGDALVTNTPNLFLAIGTADCYPILLLDQEAGVIGAAHAGWKGTVGRIAAKTVEKMVELGAQPQRIQAAIGPGISCAHYPVGQEVAQAFREAGLEACVQDGQQPHLDLLLSNETVLRDAGVSAIWRAERCSTEADFYSFRRDSGRTGRMWAVIGLAPAAQ